MAVMNRYNARQQGFSLLELIVVITIVALLTGGGLHSWLAYRHALCWNNMPGTCWHS